MIKRKPDSGADWRYTPEGDAAYREARAKAQEAANQDGFDRGIEYLNREFRVFLLPKRENRYGYELRCEVVSCDYPAKCRPGHGPLPIG